MKQACDLRAADFISHPVWEYAPEGPDHDECDMLPVAALPVENLDQRCLGIQVRLADGSLVWAIMRDLWPNNLAGTIESQSFTFLDGQHACDWPIHSGVPGSVDSAGLANFLGRTAEAVFPFSYDASQYVNGDLTVTRRHVSIQEEQLKW